MAKQHGELIVDHRASPGLTEAQARFCGYDPKHCIEGKLFEAETLTCSHCKCTVVKNPLRTRARENCPKCGNHYVCDFCYAKMQAPGYSHLPFEKIADLTMDYAAKGIVLNTRNKLLLAATKSL